MLARQFTGAESPVSTIMTRDFEVVRDDLDVDRLAKHLLARRVSCAAVSDAHGHLIGFAAALMASERVHRVVVVASKRVVGMVSALDVLTWLARRDGLMVDEHPKSGRRVSSEYAIA